MMLVLQQAQPVVALEVKEVESQQLKHPVAKLVANAEEAVREAKPDPRKDQRKDERLRKDQRSHPKKEANAENPRRPTQHRPQVAQ